MPDWIAMYSNYNIPTQFTDSLGIAYANKLHWLSMAFLKSYTDWMG